MFNKSHMSSPAHIRSTFKFIPHSVSLVDITASVAAPILPAISGKAMGDGET